MKSKQRKQENKIENVPRKEIIKKTKANQNGTDKTTKIKGKKKKGRRETKTKQRKEKQKLIKTELTKPQKKS